MQLHQIQNIVEQDGIVFLTYGGFLTQTLITAMTEALEKEAQNNDLAMGTSTNIFTIFIELSQNMMNYAKAKEQDETNAQSQGLIVVGKDSERYFIHSQNIVTKADKDKIAPLLKQIQTMSREEIKKAYRKLRKSGKNTHAKGGGIGFYEVAKRSSSIDYEFTPINSEKYYFHFIATVQTNKTKRRAP